MLTDLTFAKGYRVLLPHDLPGTRTHNFFYIPPVKEGGKDGLLVHIQPDVGDDWVGCYAFGDFGQGLSAVVGSPQFEKLFVVAKGAGYLVSTSRPAQWEKIVSLPVVDIRIIAAHKLILFSDFTKVSAYGRDGLLWHSIRLCWDDLKNVGVENQKILGSGYDPTNSQRPLGHFELDLFTGEIVETDFAYAYQQNLF